MNALKPSTSPSSSLVIATQSGANLRTSSRAGMVPMPFSSFQRQETFPSRPSLSDHRTVMFHPLSHSRLQSRSSLLPASGILGNRGSSSDPSTSMLDTGLLKYSRQDRVFLP